MMQNKNVDDVHKNYLMVTRQEICRPFWKALSRLRPPEIDLPHITWCSHVNEY